MSVFACLPPNPPFKLSGRGGRLMGKRSILIAAAPSRSLRALRYTDATNISRQHNEGVQRL